MDQSITPPGEMEPGGVKHATGHVEERAVHAFRNSVLLRGVWWRCLVLRPAGVQLGRKSLVEELSATIGANATEYSTRLILHPRSHVVKAETTVADDLSGADARTLGECSHPQW